MRENRREWQGIAKTNAQGSRRINEMQTHLQNGNELFSDVRKIIVRSFFSKNTRENRL